MDASKLSRRAREDAKNEEAETSKIVTPPGSMETEWERIKFVVETLEEKVETLESESPELRTENADLKGDLDECREICRTLNSALEASQIMNMNQEMEEAMRTELRILRRAVGNAPATAQEVVPRLNIEWIGYIKHHMKINIDLDDKLAS